MSIDSSDITYWSLSRAIDEYLLRSSEERHGLAPGYPSYPGPTSASIVINGEVHGSCLRQVYYGILGYKGEPHNARMLKIWEFGKLIEKQAQQYLKEMGLYRFAGVRFYLPDMKVKGELDFIIEVPEYGRFIVENKSYYGYKARRDIMGSRSVAGQPKFENLLQTFIYTYAFRDGNQYGFEPLNGAKILYWARDDLVLKDFDIRCVQHGDTFCAKVDGTVMPQVNIGGIKDLYTTLYEYIGARQLPPRDYNPLPSDEEIQVRFDAGKISKTTFEKFTSSKTEAARKMCADWQCRYCSYYEQCMSDGE